MKKFYFFALFIVVLNFSSFSAPVIKTVASGNWTNASDWSLNRLPQIGDTIEVSAGNTVIINSDIVVNGGVYVKVYGTVSFQNNNSTIALADPSTIQVYTGGKITGASASQKIRIAGNVVYQGNSVIIGPLVATSSTFGFVGFSTITLPVKFVGFTLAHKDNDVLVQWSTSNEVNANMYQVQRSVDGINWNTIAYVAAVNNSASLHNYSYTDKNNSAKIAYYRIEEIDLGGKSIFTAVQSIKSESTSSVEIKIASVQNKVLLQFPQEIRGSLSVRFVSENGQVVDQQTINNPVGQIVLNSKVTGNYIIAISNGQNINTAKQVIL